jgi:RNA polymerase sigma-70 factor (ECF subfamily)
VVRRIEDGGIIRAADRIAKEAPAFFVVIRSAPDQNGGEFPAIASAAGHRTRREEDIAPKGNFVTDSAVNESGEQSRTSLSLLARVRARDQSAWDKLVRLYGPMVYGWCLRAGLQAADAADVGQEVFAAVARAIDGFRHDREGDTFRGWLFTITRNKIRDRAATPGALGAVGAGGSDAQRRLAELAAEPPPEGNSTCDADGSTEVKALCRRAIDLVRGEFEAPTWTAFVRAFVNGDAPADIAADLGISVNAVYLAKSRILRRLREEFASLVDFGPAGIP